MAVKQRLIFGCVILSVFFNLQFVFCQEVQSNPLALSLTDVILTAFKNNKDIQIQEKEVLIAQSGILGAKSAFLPQVNLKAAYTHNDKVLAENIFTGYRNDNLADLTLAESIYNGGANIANFNQSKLSLDVQRETLRVKKLDIEFDAKRLYYGLLLATETLRIAQDALDQAIAHYEVVKKMYEQGSASRFDMLQSGIQVSLLEPDVVKAKNDIESLKVDLNKLLSRNPDFPIVINEKLACSFLEIKEDEFLKIAYLDRPEMKLKNLGVDIDKWGIQMAESGYRPSIDFLAGYSWRSNNLGNMLNEKQSNWNAGLAVNVPIFEGFSTKAKVDAARVRFAQAKISKENLYEQIAVDVRKGCLSLKQAQAIIKSQEDNVNQAKEALRIAEVSYANGVAINLDVLDAQTSLAQIQRNLVSGIYDYLMALAYLERSIGKPFIKENRYEK
ncbi:MAG: TolC family protein [Candidatus Omnitrophica bacterium]|nr:TolC family protein [Candidatus Omnitrophota bacterium]